MPTSLSEVGISNIGLSMIGAKSIRDFDEDNKRARLSKIFYEMKQNAMLEAYDYTFTRKIQVLAQLTTTSPKFAYVYQLPSDCLKAIKLIGAPKGTKWVVSETTLLCDLGSVTLRYTAKPTSPAKFSYKFIEALSTKIARMLAPAIAPNYKGITALRDEGIRLEMDAQGIDANIGQEDIIDEMDPDNDSFVHPDGYVDAYEDTYRNTIYT